MTTPPLPEQIELYRDRMWRRDEDVRVESAVDAERSIEDVGFAKLRSLTPALSQWERGQQLTDARRAGPSFRNRDLALGQTIDFAVQAFAPSPNLSQRRGDSQSSASR